MYFKINPRMCARSQKMPIPDSLELIHCACLRRFGSDSVNAKRFHRHLLDFQQALYRECGMRATSVRALMRVLEKLTSRMLCVHLFNQWHILCRTRVLDKLDADDAFTRARVLDMLTSAQGAFTARYGPAVDQGKIEPLEDII